MQYINGIFLIRKGEPDKKRRDRKKYCDKGLQEEEKEMVNLWEATMMEKEKREINYRQEKDSIGSKQVPKDVYYGVQSLRAAENFRILWGTVSPCSGKFSNYRALYASRDYQ